MKQPLVIFGTGEFAEVAAVYFRHDSDYEPIAFTVDPDHITVDSFCGLPVFPFDTLESHIPPAAAEMFIAIGYSGLNRYRIEKVRAATARGYRLASYLSSRATTWPDFALGRNCFILEDNTIQPFTQIGDNTILWSGNHIGHHSRIGAHCYIAGHVVVAGRVSIGDGCFVGCRATLRDGIEVGDNCVIGMGSLIMKDAPPGSVYAPRATERSRVPSHRLRRL